MSEPISSSRPLPPTIVTQHAQPQRRFVLLTAQVNTACEHYTVDFRPVVYSWVFIALKCPLELCTIYDHCQKITL